MCETLERCDKCELYVNENPFWGCMFEQIGVRPEVNEKVIAAVEKWSTKHPIKTRLMDFREKFPNAPLSDLGFPYMLPTYLGYCPTTLCSKCLLAHKHSMASCWNMPLEE